MEYLYAAIIIILSIALSIPLGKYCAKVFKGEKTILDFLDPFENFIFKI